jgi:hypothetical protein
MYALKDGCPMSTSNILVAALAQMASSRYVGVCRGIVLR